MKAPIKDFLHLAMRILTLNKLPDPKFDPEEDKSPLLNPKFKKLLDI